MCDFEGKTAQQKSETASFKSDYEQEMRSSRLFLNFLPLTRRVKGDLKKKYPWFFFTSFLFSKGASKGVFVGILFLQKMEVGFCYLLLAVRI